MYNIKKMWLDIYKGEKMWLKKINILYFFVQIIKF